MAQSLTSSGKKCPWNSLALVDDSRMYLDIHFMGPSTELLNCILNYYFSQSFIFRNAQFNHILKFNIFSSSILSHCPLFHLIQLLVTKELPEGRKRSSLGMEWGWDGGVQCGGGRRRSRSRENEDHVANDYFVTIRKAKAVRQENRTADIWDK